MNLTHWELFQYCKVLEDYLCECISLLAQHDIAPPDPTDERVKAVLQEKFINAIKGE